MPSKSCSYTAVMLVALASSAVMRGRESGCVSRVLSRVPEMSASPATPPQLMQVSVASPSKLPAVSCNASVGDGANIVRVERAGSARADAGRAAVVRLSDRRPRCADVEKVVLVLPAAAGDASRGASITVPSSSAPMAGLRPAVLVADRGDVKAALCASNSVSVPVLAALAVPSARQVVSWWVGASGDGGRGAAVRMTEVITGSCTRRMAWLYWSPMYRAPLAVSSAMPQGYQKAATVPMPSVNAVDPEPANVVTTPSLVVMRRMRWL